MIARVTLEIALRKEFDYLVPPELARRVEVGSRVKVPFGHRHVMGCVTALLDDSPHTNLRAIEKVVGAQSLVTPGVLELARWIARYYCCPPEIALKSVLPEAVRREEEGWRERLFVRAIPLTGELPKLTKRQQEVWNILEERREIALQELLELAETTAETVRRLEDKGLVSIAPQISERDPYAHEHILPTQNLTLNAEQAAALEKIKAALDARADPGSTRLWRVAAGVTPAAPGGVAGTSQKEGMVVTSLAPGFRRDAENDPPEAGATQAPATRSGGQPLITELTVRRRRLPHFEAPGATYHVTWRTHASLILSPPARQAALDACQFWHGNKVLCKIACVMPDHVHLILQPLETADKQRVGTHSLSELLHSIKSFSAHAVNKLMQRKGPVWNDESFDRMIRSEADLHEKWNYIWNNPRDLKLVGPMEEYPFIWTPGKIEGAVESPDAPSFRRDAENDPPEAGAIRALAARVPSGTRVSRVAAGVTPAASGGIAGSSEKESAGAPSPSTFLLHGVTGSGKTEVYLQAIAHTLAQGKGAIVLVPEIALTPQTVDRFKARFSSGPQQTLVAVLHSHLSAGERHDEWHKIRQGRARIVIGARSAIFAPVEPLGLVIVDEEHEHSYKQEEAPRYHARDVAVVRGQREGAVIVLGSATPSLESFYNVQKGKYALLELPHRADHKKMPVVRVVDMRQAARKEKGSPIFSPQLKEAITQRLERGEQTILFLNRRGFSTSLQCPKCGYVAQCPNCSLSLTYHRRAQQLRCHVCAHSEAAPAVCPDAKCRNPAIRYAGLGTEKVEDTLVKLFPHARVQRMDSDLMKRKEDYRKVLGDFGRGKIDILVGTQMIAKGLHFERVTLVGVIYADLGLHVPDFRAGERTFQLLTQVAGRAGRGDVEGEVFVQAFTPFHPAIQYARRHDFAGFYEQEMEFREQLQYPPVSRAALLTLKGRNEDKVRFVAEHVRVELDKFTTGTTGKGEKEKRGSEESDFWLAPAAPPPLFSSAPFRDLIIAGPAPAPLLRAETYFRYQIMLRTRQMSALSLRLAALIEGLKLPEDVTLTVDIDPVSLA